MRGPDMVIYVAAAIIGFAGGVLHDTHLVAIACFILLLTQRPKE